MSEKKGKCKNCPNCKKTEIKKDIDITSSHKDTDSISSDSDYAKNIEEKYKTPPEYF